MVNRAKIPSCKVVIDNQVIQVFEDNNYCWTGFIQTECLDSYGPMEILDKDVNIVVGREKEIDITFSRKPESVICEIWKAGSEEPIKLNLNELKTSNLKGQYTLSVFAVFKQGNVLYLYRFDVE